MGKKGEEESGWEERKGEERGMQRPSQLTMVWGPQMVNPALITLY